VPNVRKYTELANELRKDILSGKYGTEGGLPGADELTRRSGLARNTVNSALALLEGEGLIKSRDRIFYVNITSQDMTQYVPPLNVRMQSSGKIAFMENIAPIEVKQIPEEIADRLGIARESIGTFRFRVGGEVLEGQKKPSQLKKYWYLISLNEEQLQQLRDDPNTDILVKYAPEDLRAHDEISSRLPTQEEMKLLSLSEFTPITQVNIITRDTSGNILLFQDLTFVGVVLTYDYGFKNRPKDIK
jgi:DNA-binding GntR family transcriptional regulator